MIEDLKTEFFRGISLECLELIKEKNVNVTELAFEVGLSVKDFYKYFITPQEDLSFYLRVYDLLLNW